METITINELAQIYSKHRETIARALKAANLEPVEMKGRSKLYDRQAAIKACDSQNWNQSALTVTESDALSTEDTNPQNPKTLEEYQDENLQTNIETVVLKDVVQQNVDHHQTQKQKILTDLDRQLKIKRLQAQQDLRRQEQSDLIAELETSQKSLDALQNFARSTVAKVQSLLPQTSNPNHLDSGSSSGFQTVANKLSAIDRLQQLLSHGSQD